MKKTHDNNTDNVDEKKYALALVAHSDSPGGDKVNVQQRPGPCPGAAIVVVQFRDLRTAACTAQKIAQQITALSKEATAL